MSTCFPSVWARVTWELQSLVSANEAVVMLCIVILALCAVQCSKCFWDPLNHVQEHSLRPVGQWHVSAGFSERYRKKVGDIPPPFPNGWFRVVDTIDLPPHPEAKHVTAWGEHLVVYRGQDGKIRVLDAYCPHLGANLGQGGKVVGNNIECPFHGWEFNGEGKCVNIPYCDTINQQTHTVSYPCVEAHGSVYVWFHVDKVAPQYPCPIEAKVASGSWTYHGRAQEQINCHVQEIPENGADVAHLGKLHAPFVVPVLDRCFSHGWTASWKAGKGDKAYMSDMFLSQWWKLGNAKLPGSQIDVDVNQIGPGIVHLKFHTPFGLIFVIEHVTPVAPLVQTYHHVVFGSFTVPRFVAKLVLRGLVAQADKDIPVWNHKTYRRKAVVVKNDGPILAFRRWYNQFYSDNSLTLRDIKEQSLEW